MTEFVMLAGTELAVTMIRNRIAVSHELIDDVLDFAESYCVGMYHVRIDANPEAPSYIYFENHIDKDNVTSLCQKISAVVSSDSKYH